MCYLKKKKRRYFLAQHTMPQNSYKCKHHFCLCKHVENNVTRNLNYPHSDWYFIGIDLLVLSSLWFAKKGRLLLKLDLQPGRKIVTIFSLLIKSSLLLLLPHHLIHYGLSVQLDKMISEDICNIGTIHASSHKNF